MNRRRKRFRRNKDIYGIYEIPDYQKKKPKKKKKKFTFRNIVTFCVWLVVLTVLVYGVSVCVKLSMKNKAYTLYLNEDYEAALNMFEEALVPGLPMLEFIDNDIRFYMADCYVNMGQYGLACCEYSKIRIWGYNKDLKNLEKLENIAYGLQLYDWKEYRSALPILLEAYESGYSDLVLYVGSCYGQTGDLSNMQIYYDVFLRKNDMNSFMYAQYAAIALDQGRLEEAIQYIEQGKQLKDQSNIKELLFDEIIYYEKLKDYNMAYEKAKAFVEAYPNDKDGKNEYDILFTRQTVE